MKHHCPPGEIRGEQKETRAKKGREVGYKVLERLCNVLEDG